MSRTQQKGDINPLVILLSFFFTAGIIWFMQYRWRRRRIYELIGKMKKPPGYHAIRHALMILQNPSLPQIFDILVENFNEHGPNFAVWFLTIPTVVVGKPEDLETVMQSPSCVAKSYLYEFTKIAVGDGLFTAPVHKWRKNRKVIQPTFNSKILNTFVPIFAETSRICVEEILSKYVGKKDVKWYRIFTSTNLDTICQTAMGVNTDAQRHETLIGKYLESGMRTTFLRICNVCLHPDLIFNLTKQSSELDQSVVYWKKFTSTVLEEKKKKFKKELEESEHQVDIEDAPIKRKAFLEMLLELDYRGNKFTDKELVDEVMTFFVGGTDTSAVTSCFFLAMMGMHQDIQQKVYEEIMDVWGPDGNADMDDLAKLDLLERCLKETMRIFPPAPFISREVREKEVELSDCTLPVGAMLILPIFYTHRCPDYWDDPLKFDPDRFLPEAVAKRHPYSYIPFSGGLRGCIGMRYSYMNLKTLQSMILRKYKVYCDYKSVEEIRLMNCIVLRPVDGFKFYLEERN